MVSRQDTRGEARFGHDHVGGALEVTRGSSAGGRGRRHLPGRGATFQQAAGLDMAGGGFEADGAFIQRVVDANVFKFPTLETGFVVMRVVTGKGSVVVTASPPYFSVFQSGFFIFGQGGR